MLLLDTDHCVYILNGKPEEVVEQFNRIGQSSLAVTHFTIAELAYGACKSRHRAANMASIDKLCKRLVVLPFEDSVVRRFGELKAALDATGQLSVTTAMGGRVKRDFDIAIAATALVYGHTLVTHNSAHYSGIEGLNVEDWHP